MSKDKADFKYLSELNILIKDVDREEAKEKLSDLERTILNEISALEDGEVVCLGIGMTLEEIESKKNLKQKVLKNIRAWRSLLNEI